ncbi:type VI lipase adapter Tla3 domain-containing protein [Burkholderia diffusa]|uniref:type VI lipase adapter Tla3 domain-containing protein n=1 Tax=Burkholderia diffusa TaxID=488732 RepID=UPI002ABD20A2|nr:DUF2875 family protein [Burkholderia diffusa]
MITTNVTRPPAARIFLLALAILTLLWIAVFEFVVGKEGFLGGNIAMYRRLSLLILPPLLLAAGVSIAYGASLRRDSASRDTLAAARPSSANEAVVSGEGSRDARFTLEIRRFGVAVDRFRQRALLMRLDEVGANGTLLLQDPKQYPWSSSDRSFAGHKRENNVFGYTLRGWVDYWPIPVIVAGPPRNENDPDADRMATHISSADNGAGIGNTLYTRLDEIHTANGDDVVSRAFDIFDREPDLPAVVLLVEDGINTRSYLGTPGADYLGLSTKDGNFVPKNPDSYVALLVTRKDRVDRQIRPYVVDAPEAIDNTQTRYDVIKLWNYFWQLQKAHWKKGEKEMPVDYWQAKLPEFWNTASPKMPNGFKPNPWVPIPWTTWQLKEYDRWPVLANLHRPVRVDLSNGHGAPLKKGERIEKIRAGWQQAVGTLAPGEQPGRMFYDTGASTANLALLVQSLHDNPQHIDIDDPKDAFDMQRRIGGDTGTSSIWVQTALALMMGYGDGKTSALINMRDPLHATIVMLTPPDAASRQAHPQTFSWDF